MKARIEAAMVAILFAYGAGICLFYGRIGFMSLDHSIIYDGAWRILSGQIPFRDFNTPNGIVPMILQATFFNIFGVDWFAYCLHAACVNGAFCILVYLVLKLLEVSRSLSLFYAFLSGIVFYPPLGVPFMEQHAFFFVLFAIVLAVNASESERLWVRVSSWVLVPFMCCLAYCSKQIPTLFALPLLAYIMGAMTKRAFRKEMYVSITIAGISLCLLLLGLFTMYELDLARFKLYFIDLPSETGAARISHLLLMFPRSVLLIFYPALLKSVIMYSFFFIYLMGFLLLLFMKKALAKSHGHETDASARQEVERNIAVAFSLVIICNLFIACTMNQGENGIPYIFVSLGIVHAEWSKFMNRVASNKQRLLKLGITVVFIFVALFDAITFNFKVNKSRIVNDFIFTKAETTSYRLPQELKFMVFAVPGRFPKMRADDLRKTVDYLKEKKENFLLIGDTSILYALTKKPSVNPSLWFHEGLTMPAFGTERFSLYENELIENMKKYNVKYIVVEGKETFFHAKVSKFNALDRLIKERSCAVHSYGWFRLIQLCP